MNWDLIQQKQSNQNKSNNKLQSNSTSLHPFRSLNSHLISYLLKTTRTDKIEPRAKEVLFHPSYFM